jgi:hypothetical protein
MNRLGQNDFLVFRLSRADAVNALMDSSWRNCARNTRAGGLPTGWMRAVLVDL